MSLNRQEKAARLRRVQGLPTRVPTPPVTAHVHRLLTAGWTRLEIAAHTGLERRTIRSAATGERPTMHHRTATAILKLRPQDAPGRVAPDGTVRRIRALAVMGWPATHIADEAGLGRSFIGDVMSGGYRRIPREVAAAVDGVFRARWMVPGPSTAVRTSAARKGWVPALAWDDIDDPDEQPTGVRVAS